MDHIRAIAIFLVFVWHFIRFGEANKAAPLVFPLSIFTEGHTGVALFMTLSGYLFAKLLDGRSIDYRLFIWNRIVRLLPLLLVAIALMALLDWHNAKLEFEFFKRLASGILLPTLPQGGWSITVEFHFYLVLPLLLIVLGSNRYNFVYLLLIFTLSRALIYAHSGDVQYYAYLTIVGRIDQFLLGIVAFQNRHWFAGKNWLALLIGSAFLVTWYLFDLHGGYYATAGSAHPAIWVFLPTVEGLAYGSLIAWYDNSLRHRRGMASSAVASIGTYAYAIYLLHFFVVDYFAIWIDRYLIALSNPYVLLLAAVPSFFAMIPIAYAGHRLVEMPCMRFRKRYVYPRPGICDTIIQRPAKATTVVQ